MTDPMVALLSGWVIGRLRPDRRGRRPFNYNEDWRDARRGYPLSAPMPLIGRLADNTAFAATDCFGSFQPMPKNTAAGL